MRLLSLHTGTLPATRGFSQDVVVLVNPRYIVSVKTLHVSGRSYTRVTLRTGELLDVTETMIEVKRMVASGG